MKSKDINVKIEDYILNCRAVAILIVDNKILLHKRKQDKVWALPGGKIKVGETSKQALDREIREELGLEEFEIGELTTISEYFFTHEQNKYHQYIFGHKVFPKKDDWILNQVEFYGIEKNEDILFKWFHLDKLDEIIIKPDFLKKQLLDVNKKELQFISYQDM